MKNYPVCLTARLSQLCLTQGDITLQETDAIVNAANSGLMGGGGVDGAVHRAGGPAILAECRQIVALQGPLPPGQAVITTSGNLKAKYVIHTVGPVWYAGSRNEPETLASAYRESLQLATGRGLNSVSFPSISTGAYGYPVEAAAKVALATVYSYLIENTTSLKQVVFVLFGAAAFRAYATALEEIRNKQHG